MKAWVLGIEGNKFFYRIHFDMFKDGKIEQNQMANILVLDIENKTVKTDKGIFSIVDNYKEFCALELK